MNVNKDKRLLVQTMSRVRGAKNIAAFLDDLLTEEEILDLAQRVKIAKMILDGKVYDEISEKVGASTATVSKIGQIIKYGKSGFAKTLSKK